MKTFWRRKYSFAALASVMLVSQCCCCFLPIRVQLETAGQLSSLSTSAQAVEQTGSLAGGSQNLCWDEKQIAAR
jgi:uncharacterized protein YfaA (DUF2138 family)